MLYLSDSSTEQWCHVSATHQHNTGMFHQSIRKDGDFIGARGRGASKISYVTCLSFDNCLFEMLNDGGLPILSRYFTAFFRKCLCPTFFVFAYKLENSTTRNLASIWMLVEE